MAGNGPAVLPKPADIGARAFTAGNDIAFGAGEYAPGAASGNQMIAHEAAHVLEQRAPTDDTMPAPPAGAINNAVGHYGE